MLIALKSLVPKKQRLQALLQAPRATIRWHGIVVQVMALPLMRSKLESYPMLDRQTAHVFPLLGLKHAVKGKLGLVGGHVLRNIELYHWRSIALIGIKRIRYVFVLTIFALQKRESKIHYRGSWL
jgi:hypothetical protein